MFGDKYLEFFFEIECYPEINVEALKALEAIVFRYYVVITRESYSKALGGKCFSAIVPYNS